MKEIEKELLELFLKRFHIPVEIIKTQVPVGSIPELPPGSPDYLARMVEHLYPKKIDLVVDWPGEIWIVELADKGRPGHISRLLLYRDLYQEQYLPTKPIHLKLAAYIHDPDIRKPAAEAGIELITLP